MDSDDAVTPTAFEGMYRVAEKFNADVVSCQKWYTTPMNGDVSDEDSLKVTSVPNTQFVDKPTLVTQDIAKRLESLHQRQFVWSVWAKIIRRDFILKNNIEMPDILGEDAVFAFCLACANSKYFYIPDINYIYRIRDDSQYRVKDTVEVSIHKWGMALTKGFNYCNDFLNRQKIFQSNPKLKISALEVIANEFIGYFLRLYRLVPQYDIENFKEVRAEFEACENLPEITTFIFNRMNNLQLNFDELHEENQSLLEKLKQASAYLKKQQEIIRQLESELQQK